VPGWSDGDDGSGGNGVHAIEARIRLPGRSRKAGKVLRFELR